MINVVEQSATSGAGLSNRLKLERIQRHWSIDDLANRSGVSRAMISKIERGESSPTAATLGRLSAAIGLTMSQLMARTEGAGGYHLRKGDQSSWFDPATGLERRNLTPQIGPTTPLELVWVELPRGQSVTYPAAAYAFIDDQQIFVLAGELGVRQGARAFELKQGDTLRLGPPEACRFENPGRTPCRYVIAVLRSW